MGAPARGFTLIEVAFSIAIVALAVLTIMLLIPAAEHLDAAVERIALQLAVGQRFQSGMDVLAC